MDFNFTYELSADVVDEVASFFDSMHYCAIENFPQWGAVVPFSGKICHFIARRNGEIVSYANIFERVVNIAFIEFGPLSTDPDILIASLKELYTHYRLKGVSCLRIQPGFASEQDAAYVQQQLRKEIHFRLASRSASWCSLVIDLKKEPEEIFKGFSKGHKSAIKKSAKNGLKACAIENESQLEAFIAIFIKMHKARGLAVDAAFSKTLVSSIHAFISSQNRGQFLVVIDRQNNVCGGIIAIKQGATMRYYKGAADPDKRQYAILHLAIYEAILQARKEGLLWFDLWGYKADAKKGEQQYAINTFKKGFGGEFIYYPRTISFVYKPLRFALAHAAATSLEPFKGGMRALLKRRNR